MSINHVNNLKNQIIETIQTLSQEQQQKVLEFAQSLQENSRFQKWDRISDEEAQALQNEFAQEDIGFSESILPDYLSQLEQEDRL
jgi:DNA-binding helix-hairpin-helix protein with protein kinase domain